VLYIPLPARGFTPGLPLDFTLALLYQDLMKINPLTALSIQQLRRAIELKQQSEALEQELARILGPKPSIRAPVQPPRRRTMSAAAKAKIAAAQKARWAERKRAVKAVGPIKPPAKRKRKISRKGRARMIAATKARWARFRASF
jgi:hypothetical protein